MRLFSKHHLWVEQYGKQAKIGISDYAQNQLGVIMFINMPEIDDQLKINDKFSDIESIKTVTDLYSPVDGKVISVNKAVIDEPSLINENPYHNWVIEVFVEKLDDDLMTEEEYNTCKESL